MYRIVYTKQAAKDAKKLKSCGLDKKAKELMKVMRINPFQNPPAGILFTQDKYTAQDGFSGARRKTNYYPRPKIHCPDSVAVGKHLRTVI